MLVDLSIPFGSIGFHAGFVDSKQYFLFCYCDDGDVSDDGATCLAVLKVENDVRKDI